jgi:nucleoside-diphosphate-sugar epimerase
MKKILVTGGAGFVGSEVVKKLHQKGFKVRVADEIAKPKEFPSVEYFQVDLTNYSQTLELFKGVDECVNLAARIGGVGYMSRYPAKILDDNNQILSTTFRAAKEARLGRMIYASTSMVYQRSKTYPSKESHTKEVAPPTNIYGFSKLLGEYYCKAFEEEYGLPYTIFRLFNVYGSGEKVYEEVGAHVIPDLAKKIVDGQYPLEIMGDGRQTRPFTHVSDAAEGIVLLVEKGKEAASEDFNIGSPVETKIIDLAKMLWKAAGRREPFKAKFVPEHTHPTAHRRAVDPSKLAKLGWKPKIKLEEGLEEVVTWLQKEEVKV